ncbi:uncharacterized protein Pyn_11358 [Prunus yedoensis var. nudiflora]|uniref:Cell morphogenesis central region domain-containing protein n=1 Tax=Prunus yedoensis var. nudiflora TaxID=2094558 RepID=A0A314XJ29_PRUYE|nr:uncharacterized protein Pyn_11358 [Prunus yedoensis var. nudiflora]
MRDDILRSCYWDSGVHLILDENLMQPLLTELVKYAAELCPRSGHEAKAEVMQCLAHITSVELGGKANQSQDADNKLDQ